MHNGDCSLLNTGSEGIKKCTQEKTVLNDLSLIYEEVLNKRENKKVDFIATGYTVITHLIPLSDEENCIYTTHS